MRTTTKAKVLKLVSDHLRQARLDGITFAVVDGGIAKREDTWHIPVRASAHPASMFEYYEILVNIEEKLREKHDLYVWLIPTVPEESSARPAAASDPLGHGGAVTTTVKNDKVAEVVPSKTKKRVLDLVSRCLRQKRLGDITFDVLNGEIKKRDDTWDIPVWVSAEPPSMHRYYEVLMDVEAELREKHRLNVWLVPTLPDEDACVPTGDTT